MILVNKIIHYPHRLAIKIDLDRFSATLMLCVELCFILQGTFDHVSSLMV